MTGCLAPHVGVYLQPDGVVRSCCTTGYQLGRLGTPAGHTLRSILDGERAFAHRAALDAGDFSLGCRECEIPVRRDQRDSSLAAQFDRFAGPTPVTSPKLMDFALSNRCNLQCVMCNGDLSSAIRIHREARTPLPPVYDDAFFEELRAFLPHLERAQFKGGEPFLSPETRRVWDLLIELGVDCEVSVTTNGTVWGSDVERYVRALGMDVIVSVDGITAATFEGIRVGAAFDQVWENVDRFQAVVEDTGAGLTLSFCLMPQNHHELAGFLLETQRRGCHPNVILVNQPQIHDLTRLPIPEQDRIVAELRGRDGELTHRLTGRHLSEWRRVLAVLGTMRASPVHLRGRHTAPRDEGDAAAIRRRLTAEAGTAPLVMVVQQETVIEVEPADWAVGLDPASWVGLHVDQVGDLAARHFGGAFELTVGETAEGHQQMDAWVGDPPTAWLRLVVIARVVDGNHQRVHVVVPLPRPPGRAISADAGDR
ncbi:MAG TPA: radical SAM protein [Acidimicrobiales bacterium]|nr:radical SAM protein [Acidimicrobiales bacterium]